MSEVKSWYEDAESKLRASAELVEKIGVERDQLRAELDTLRRYYREAIDIVDEVFQSTCETDPILPDFLLPGDSKFHGVKKLAIAYRNAKAELAKLQAEREPRDNGDGTETKLLPVTYPSGWSVAEVRAPRIGDLFVGRITGEAVRCVNEFAPLLLCLILRPAPKQPEPVTWEANLGDGEWIAKEAGIESAIGYTRMVWRDAMTFVLGLSKPAKLGRYRFVNGVGTLIEAAQ